MKLSLRILASLLLACTCLTSSFACGPAPSDESATTDSVTTKAPDTETEPLTDAATDAVTDAATGAVTDAATDAVTEPETEPPFVGLTFDAATRIVIPADADEITRNAADLLAAAIAEKAGLTLSVLRADEDAAAGGSVLALGVGSFETEKTYAVTVEDKTLRLNASDPTTLYFAAEAVAEAWLTPDFGLQTEGLLTLAENRVAELNGLTTRRDTSIRVLSQNLRCTDDPNGNSVGERKPRFRQLFLEYRPDLVGTQETTASWNNYLKAISNYAEKKTDLGEYGLVGCSREGQDATSGEWNTIMYRKDRFELLDSDTTWLSDTPDEASAVEGSLCKRICTWALLKDKLTGETIIFANTHLDHSNDEIRSRQMTILMDYLADRIGQYPFYLTGDFNCRVDSVPYATVTDRLQDSHKTAWIDLSTVSNTFHSYTEEGKTEIDFIFHNDHTTPVNYEIISKPYDGYVSDHFGVFVEFVN